MNLLFNDPDEFLSELAEQGPNVEPVLRLTLSWASDPQQPYRNVSVLATYLRRMPDGRVLVVVKLVAMVGKDWGALGAPETMNTRARAETLQIRIKDAARELGIDVRAGTYDPNPAPR